MAAFHCIAALKVALAIAPAMVSTIAGAQSIDYPALQDTIGEAVTASVTGKPQRASELPASTVIVTRDDIARSPAHDVPGLLKSYAGVDVNRWTAGQSDVAIRGGVQTYNPRLLVLVDGRQVYLDHYGMTNWNLLGLELEDIQQIELVRGPASALFGPNAASGVVNIITRRNEGRPMVRLNASAGNHDLTRLSGSLSLPLSSAITASFDGHKARASERQIPDGVLRVEPMTVASDHVGGRLAGRFDETEVTVGGGYATSRQLEYLPSQLPSNQDYRSSTMHATASQDVSWGGLSATAFINWLDVGYRGRGEIADLSGGLSFGNRIASLKAAALYRLGTADTLRIGGEYRSNRVTGNVQLSRMTAYDVASLDAMVDLHPARNASITAAIRIDRFRMSETERLRRSLTTGQYETVGGERRLDRISFNAAALLNIDSDGLLRVNGGLGYQLPALLNYGLRIATNDGPDEPPVYLTGSPSLKPIGLWSAEIGYSRSVGITQIDVTGFWNHTGRNGDPASEGVVELTPRPRPTIVVRQGMAAAYDTYGAELAATGRIAALTWQANYTWTRSGGTALPEQSDFATPISSRFTTPQHKANIGFGWDADGRWNATALARYTSGTRQFQFLQDEPEILTEVDDAVAIDVRFGFRLNDGIELYAAGENLTLADGSTGSPIPADRRIRLGVHLAF